MAASLSFSASVSSSIALLRSSHATAGGPSLVRFSPVAVAVTELETKSLSELRSLARDKGLRGDTRAELIALLSSAGGAAPENGTAGSSYASPAPSVNGAASGPGLDGRALQMMPLAQLRAVARTRGVQGNNREQIIAALLGLSAKTTPSPSSHSQAPSASPYSSPAAQAPVTTPSPLPAPGAALGYARQQLVTKSLPSLRALARGKGIASASGMSKEQLISTLVGAGAASGVAALEGAWNSSFPVPASPGAPPEPAPVPVSDLEAMTLGQLRALGKELGVRGDTRVELIGLIAGSSAPPSAASAGTATATAVKEAQTLPAFESAAATVLPPFQSAVPAGGTLALEPVKLASEVSALRQAMEDMEARDKVLEEERNSLLEQANFLRNVLVGGIGLAILPLLLPLQMNTTTTTTTSPLLSAPEATTATVLAPTEPVAPPEPVVMEVSPEEYCASLPSALLSPQVAKFCEALIEPSF